MSHNYNERLSEIDLDLDWIVGLDCDSDCDKTNLLQSNIISFTIRTI